MADVRTGILEATVRLSGRHGLDGFSVGAIAVEAGVSRASVYRYFEGGRDQIVDEAVAHEVGRFVDGLGLDDRTDLSLRERLARVLSEGSRDLADHDVLASLLAREPEAMMERLATLQPVFHDALATAVAGHLEAERLAPDVDVQEASRHIARMIMSYVTSPGMWRLDDDAAVSSLVDNELLGGVLAR